MLNKTNWQHALLAVLIQLATALICAWLLPMTGITLTPLNVGLLAGGLLAVGIFFAREYAQVEYRIRSRTGRSLTALWPWHVLQPRWWTRDGVWDWLLCAAACGVVGWLAATLLGGKI